jgi:hypothetical protein
VFDEEGLEAVREPEWLPEVEACVEEDILRRRRLEIV